LPNDDDKTTYYTAPWDRENEAEENGGDESSEADGGEDVTGDNDEIENGDDESADDESAEDGGADSEEAGSEDATESDGRPPADTNQFRQSFNIDNYRQSFKISGVTNYGYYKVKSVQEITEEVLKNEKSNEQLAEDGQPAVQQDGGPEAGAKTGGQTGAQYTPYAVNGGDIETGRVVSVSAPNPDGRRAVVFAVQGPEGEYRTWTIVEGGSNYAAGATYYVTVNPNDKSKCKIL